LTKIYQLVDGHGVPLVVAASEANDAPAALPLPAQLRVTCPVGRPRTRPDRFRGDKAYSSRVIRTHPRERGIIAVIPEPSDQIGHRNAAANAAVDDPPSTPTTASSSNGASAISNNGAGSRPATTAPPPPTELPRSSSPSSPGVANQQTCSGAEAAGRRAAGPTG